MKYLVDSNIIIYHLNKDSIATNFLAKYYKDIAISQITFLEVLSFPFSTEEENDVRMLLNRFTMINIDIKVSNQAIKNRKIKKIKVPDNIIAATAMVYGLTLVTKNIKDFKVLNLNLLNPFEIV